jgi:RHS repeat-associated protein
MKSNLLLTFALAVAPLAATLASAQTSGLQPTTWKNWLQNPPTVPLTVSIPTLSAESNSMVQITLGEAQTVGYGHTNGCGWPTNAPSFVANLNVRREYLLTVVTTNLQNIELDLAVQAQNRLVTKTGSDAVPRAYATLVNRQFADKITDSTNCTYYSNSWIIEVRDQQGARWLVDDRSNDPGPAPGDGDVLQMGPAKSLLTNHISIEWGVGLGRLYDSLAAGRIRLSESALTRDLYSPAALFFAAASTNVRSQVELVTARADNSLRQVKAFQSFVDIIDPWTFFGSDVVNLSSLASRLKTETTGVSLFVSNNLCPATQQALTNYLGSGSPAEPLRSLLMQDFNTLIAGPSIYDAARFAGVSLGDETQLLLAQNPHGRDLLRLNRLLLQDAYSAQLAKRPLQTALNFYLPSQVTPATNQDGIYTNISGFPFVSWQILNPSPTSLTNLFLIESRNGLNRTNALVFKPGAGTDNWTLTYGTGAVQRIEARGISVISGAATNRYETNTIHYAGSTNAYKCIENYQLMPWGWELVQTRMDPDGANLVTSFQFYSDQNDPFTYSRPWITRYPDGYWQVQIYDYQPDPFTMEYVVLTPFNGSPLDPMDASPDNCEAAIYAPGVVNDYEVYHYAPGPLGQALLHTEYIASGSLGRNERDELQDAHINYDYAGKPIGSCRLVAGESLGKGLAGHDYFFGDHQSAFQASYFQGGTLDPVTCVFTVGSDITAGPDWRQSVIVWGVYYPYASPYTGDWVNTVEGQTIWNGLDTLTGASFYTNRTRCESTIYHNGSPAQRDIAVYTGLDTFAAPEFDLIQRFVFKNDSLGHTTNICRIDVSNPTVIRTVYEANYFDPNGSDGELLRWEIDETGSRSQYSYDALKRRTQTSKVGITNGLAAIPTVVTTTFYDACGRTTAQSLAAAGLTLSNSWSYDIAGRLVQQACANGLTTNYAYSLSGDGGQIVSVTLPSGATLVREQYTDRRLKSQTGTGVVPEFHTYSAGPVDGNGSVRLLDTTHSSFSNSPRWSATGSDCLGLQCFSRSLDFDGVNYLDRFTSYGYWLNKPDWVAVTGRANTVYGKDFDGQITEVNLGGGVTYSDSRIKQTFRAFAKIAGNWFLTETNLALLTDGSDQPTITSARLERVSGFTSSSTLSDITTLDINNNATNVTTSVNRAAKQVTEVTILPQSTLTPTRVAVNGLLITETSPTVANPTTHRYDALCRETSVTSPLGFAASHGYDRFGQITNETDFTGLSTVYEYYPNGVTGAGQVKSQTRRGKRTYYSYTARGELWQTWGDVPYPEERVYSQYGELVELHTFRVGSGWNQSTWSSSPGQADVTTWTYQDFSGLLLQKTDHLGNSVSYTYETGMVKTRSWARLVGGEHPTVTYAYNQFGEPTSLATNNGALLVQYNNYNRIGQPRQVIDGAGTSTLLYDNTGHLLATEYTFGPLAGITVTNHFDSLGRRGSLAVEQSDAPFIQQSFAYDAYGRLGTVGTGPYTAEYGYVPNSDLLQTTTCKNNGSTVLTTTRSWEYGSRLSTILNEVNGVDVSSHTYLYDALNRRRQATLEDGSIWKYDYNDRDELVSARHYWPDWAPVAGQQFGYDYDNIGNRKTASFGGDVNGWNLHTISYTANPLNQYTTICTPGYETVVGAAYATNAVTVNSATADRKSEYFHREISFDNSAGPLWQNVSASSGSASATGGLLCSGASQNLTYDLDGNLAFDGTWTYEWDAENRLAAMSMTNITGIGDAANSNRLRLEFAYDYQSRRISKSVKHWDGTDFADPVTTLFVYDGWNLLTILKPDLSPATSFLWGQDLTGTMDQASGVGGLLMVQNGAYPATNCFAAYDGNGNLTALIDASDSCFSARYEYSPYGEVLRASGPTAPDNPYQFSTKFSDRETALIYYGCRYYSPALGRWIGRDPSEEADNLNLYGFVSNGPIGSVDTDGTATLQQVKDIKRLINMSKQIKDILKIYNNPLTRVGPTTPLNRLASGGAYAMLYATLAVSDAIVDLVRGVSHPIGSLEANAADFVIHTVNGDIAEADLDAATVAAQVVAPPANWKAVLTRGYATSDAVMAWGMLTFIEDNVQ